MSTHQVLETSPGNRYCHLDQKVLNKVESRRCLWEMLVRACSCRLAEQLACYSSPQSNMIVSLVCALFGGHHFFFRKKKGHQLSRERVGKGEKEIWRAVVRSCCWFWILYHTWFLYRCGLARPLNPAGITTADAFVPQCTNQSSGLDRLTTNFCVGGTCLFREFGAKGFLTLLGEILCTLMKAVNHVLKGRLQLFLFYFLLTWTTKSM